MVLHVLSSLPGDVLAQILSGELSSHVIKLWKCGNTILNAKLGSSIADVQIRAMAALNPFQFPLMLTQLRSLRELSVWSNAPLLRCPTNWPSIVKNLPGSLKVLRIVSPDANLAFLNLAPESTSQALAYITTDYPRGPSSFVDLATLFPRLETLELRCIRNREFSMNPLDFAALPSSLTSLITTSTLRYSEESSAMVSILPKSITCLSGHFRILALSQGFEDALIADWKQAPPQLETIIGLEDVGLYATPAQWLPRTLTSLNRPSIIWKYSVSQLPPLLQTLSISRVEEDSFSDENTTWVAELPKRLTKLSVVRIDRYKFSIADLPRTLTSISLSGSIAGFIGAQWDAYQRRNGVEISSQFWPPSLIEFDAPSLIVEDHELKLLPNTIQMLSIIPRAHRSPNDEHIIEGKNLPDRLTTVTLFFENGRNIILTEFSSLSHLQSVTLTANYQYTSIKRSSLEALPSTLTSLSIPGISIDDDVKGGPRTLPPNLISLELAEWHAKWFSSIPRSVTHLQIRQLYGAKENSSEGSLFDGLPPSLTSLAMSLENSVRAVILIPTQRLSAFLPNLKILEIPFIGIFPSYFMREVPSGLEELNVRLSSFEDEDAPYLPVRLQKIDLHVALSWSESIIQHWPLRCQPFSPPSNFYNGIAKRFHEISW